MADIVLDSVVKRYPDGFEAVKNLNLTIADGEFMILVGPSGCGKSTALNMIAGLEDISAGELRIEGKVVNQVAPRDRDIAMVFQSYALYPHMTVRENMAFALRLAKVPKAEVDRKVQEAADILDLTEHLARKPANLSGGQRQRVAMGRAIVRDPKAFLMDEPLSNLDAKLRVQMRAQVARIQHKLNTTTVYVTHDQTEAMTLGDRVAVMLSGVLQQVGSPMELYNHPTNLFVAGFIGSPGMNFLPATLENGSVRLPMVDVPLPPEVRQRLGRQPDGRNLIAGIRPEDFEDAARVDGDGHTRGVTFRCKLDLVEAMGAEFYAHFGVGAKPVRSEELTELRDDAGGIEETTESGGIVAVARLSPQSRARSGEDAELWLDAAKLHFFDAESGQSLVNGR
ncbi:MAG TPA: sn-glycerol-3-phosphate ABC transporter ATP-binding protein UgpC [Solirubrobacteraceae bacterium]|nr:sn-glycerol-3-phosphate ABC transporter ATP-binding protein UgpC [Solirubrobacteraceae bacterium]